MARRLADLSASVVAVDLSAQLLAIARRHEATYARGIEYRQEDARRLDGLGDAVFDGAVCFMAACESWGLLSATVSVP